MNFVRPSYDRTPFPRGTGDWRGVVMIIRFDALRTHDPDETLCKVLSARRLSYGLKRAIVTELPYGMLKHYFRAGDGDSTLVYAELKGEHLEMYERADIKEFFEFNNPDAVLN